MRYEYEVHATNPAVANLYRVRNGHREYVTTTSTVVAAATVRQAHRLDKESAIA